jgi:hypothetical protein
MQFPIQPVNITSDSALIWIISIGQLILSWPVISLIIVIIFREKISNIIGIEFNQNGLKIKTELSRLSNSTDEITEVMAKSRILELEVTLKNMRDKLNGDEIRRMEKQIEEFGKLLAKREKQRLERETK